MISLNNYLNKMYIDLFFYILSFYISLNSLIKKNCIELVPEILIF